MIECIEMAALAKTKKGIRNNNSSSVAKIKSKKAFRTYKQAISYLFERTDYERQTDAAL